MTLSAGVVLIRATLRSVAHLLAGRVRFPSDRVGDILEDEDGVPFSVYRETALQPAVETAAEPEPESASESASESESDDGVVLVFRMAVTDRGLSDIVRTVLFDPFANVATPFFAGMPGFRRKLWLAGSRPGEFLELYEWASAADADRFVAVMQSLLEPFDAAGSASFEIVEAGTIDEYVAVRPVAWRRTSGQDRDGGRRPAWPRLAAVTAGLLAAYLAWRWLRTDASDDEQI